MKETDISTDVLETDNNISVVGNVEESNESICVDDAGQSEQTPAIDTDSLRGKESLSSLLNDSNQVKFDGDLLIQSDKVGAAAADGVYIKANLHKAHN